MELFLSLVPLQERYSPWLDLLTTLSLLQVHSMLRRPSDNRDRVLSRLIMLSESKENWHHQPQYFWMFRHASPLPVNQKPIVLSTMTVLSMERHSYVLHWET